MPIIKSYDIKTWPDDWRAKGEAAKDKLLGSSGLGVNSPEYKEYMDFCIKLILYGKEVVSE